MHYCKGKLESVSVFFAAKCEEPNIPANLPACCKKALANHCTKKESKRCCDDEVMVLKQDISSLTPSFVKWVDVTVNFESFLVEEIIPAKTSLPKLIEENNSDSGPPIYILHQVLIFYA